MMYFILLCLALQIPEHSAAKRNILFLASDDLRPNLGCYQDANSPIFVSPEMFTPNLDNLARESILFKKAYVQQALCSPSRTSLLTSRRPDTTHITSIGPYFRDIGGNFTTIPQFFKEHGFRTIGGGKIFHGGSSSGADDIEYSWSEKYHHAGHNKDNKTHIWRSFTEEEIAENPLQDTAEADYIIERMRELAPAAILGEENFFLAYGVHKPHMPWFFPDKFLDYYPEDSISLPPNPYVPEEMPQLAWNPPPIGKYADCNSVIPNLGDFNVTLPEWKVSELRRAYYATVSYADHEIGRVLEELELLGLSENTIVVFWGDHGWQLGEHAEWAKQTTFEIANRVPFLLRVPGMTDQGLMTDKLVEMVDLFPTLVEAAEFPALETCSELSNETATCTEGSSLMPLLQDPNNEAWKTAVFWQYPRGHNQNHIPAYMGYSVRDIRYHYTEWVHIKHLGHHNYQPEWNNPADHEELYDLQNDPQENFNLYNDPKFAEVKENLSKMLRSGWRDHN